MARCAARTSGLSRYSSATAKHPTALLRRPDHPLAATTSIRDRLLQQHVLAGAKGALRRLRLHVMRQRDDHRGDAGIRQGILQAGRTPGRRTGARSTGALRRAAGEVAADAPPCCLSTRAWTPPHQAAADQAHTGLDAGHVTPGAFVDPGGRANAVLRPNEEIVEPAPTGDRLEPAAGRRGRAAEPVGAASSEAARSTSHDPADVRAVIPEVLGVLDL